ncbi:ATP-grasp domain-containing protein [Steroidobacter sp.]|uniref:carboxylate--amine ligase n=1 Tax=Steroidobacter sp. TaxID=1978227 RepID=UPI001A39F259|nr:ATP-grasp domain-containing protein [Steroidobacter sp.]MBL8268389.1 ATP-grasp domain-containing protein [Steroidobacter sp.]
MTRILITDGDNRSALAATRALGQLGHQVFIASEAHPSLASASKYAAGFDAYKSPYVAPDRFVSDVAEILQRRQIEVLLPMTEITTILLTRHQAALPAQVRIPFPAADVVATAADKASVLRLAQSIGVPIPVTQIVERAEDIDDFVKRVDYPAVFKPSRSRTWTGEQWVSSGAAYAANADDLRERLRKLHPAVFPVLIQERIVGPGVGVFVCCDESRVLATFAHRRLREKPPSGGVSVLCESAPVDPIAREHATRLLKEIGWRGVAMVEFKQDASTGTLKLMEINGRFWGSLQLAIDAGVNFPQLALDIALSRAQPVTNYRVGVRSRWFWGDTDAMIALLLRSREQLNLPANHPGRWRTFLNYLLPWRPGTRYELERLSDPGPALLAARRWLLRK